MAHAHVHAHGRPGAHRHSHAPPLKTALALTFCVGAIELAGSYLSHSLALAADAAHVFMDVASLGIALAASLGAGRPANDRQSYGFARFEILAALANGILLFAVAAIVALGAISRFGSHAVPEGGLMAGVAALGLAVNAGVGISLVRAAHGNLNVRAALMHVASDMVSSFAVALGGLAILATGIGWIDPALSLIVAAIIVAGVTGIVRESADVLLQSTPAHVELADVRARMAAVAGVVGVHDLHIWSIGSGSHVLSAHVLLADAKISEATSILRALEARLRGEFSIDHVTIQFECESCDPTGLIVCTMPALGAVPGNPEI